MMRVCSATILTIVLVRVAAAREFWLDVPFVAQVRDGCGTACISMIVRYWNQHSGGKPKTPGDEPAIRGTVPFHEGTGVLARDMELYLKDHGFQAFAFRGKWGDLADHLLKGRPLIVCLRESKSKLHYIVVAGIDEENNLVLVNDPARRKLVKMKRVDFEDGWKGSGNWTLLAVP